MKSPPEIQTLALESIGQSTAAAENRVNGPQFPKVHEFAVRSGLPLIMLAIVLLTVLWGGFVTFIFAVLLWKLAGVIL